MPLRQPLNGWLEGGLAILDSAGRITGTKEALSHWLELPNESIVGHRFWTLLAERCGRDQEELPPDRLRQADASIPSDLSQARTLAKLAKQF